LNGYCHDSIQESLKVFEHLGFLSTTGLLYYHLAIYEKSELLMESAKAIADTLKNYIQNHLGTSAPCYDGHIIEISETIFFLSGFGEN
jgi:hypothetical protein